MGDSKQLLVSLSAAIIGLLGVAAPSGLLAPEAAALMLRPPSRTREEESQESVPLLLPPRHADPSGGCFAHRSHRSHSSHRSGSGYRSYSPGGSDWEPSPTPTPAPPKPATIYFAAFPGGRIFVDGHFAGRDSTAVLSLSAGSHEVRIENRFLGTKTVNITLTAGQDGEVKVDW